MKKGFTLIEMLVVIGIISVLTAASVAGYTKLTASAENTRAKELVANVATAMAAMYQREGAWPKRLVTAASSGNLLDEEAALPLGKKGYLSLDMNDAKTKLEGYDQFGIITPWALTTLKNRGKGNFNKGTRIGSSGKTVVDHTLRFAIDDDGDGITELPGIDGNNDGQRVRAVVCVWCCSKDGSLRYRDICKSWTKGQVVK